MWIEEEIVVYKIHGVIQSLVKYYGGCSPNS